MKIVYTILGTYNSGGMERVLANKANYLANLGYNITIITTDQRSRAPYFSLESSIKCIDLAVNYTDPSQGLYNKLTTYFKKQRLHRKLLTRLLEEINPDITISMFDNDASFVYKIKDGSKKILEIHFSRFKRLQYARKGLLKWIDYWRSKNDLAIVQHYDRFVVLTEEDRGYWGKLANIEVIANANSFESAYLAPLHNKAVLAVGRYDYQKGFDDLIKAWAIVYQQKKDWRLHIYGEGPLHSSLQQLIEQLGMGNSIFLMNPTKNIEEVYMDHAILAMTSRYEGLPMVLLEAQACGLPMVAYACKCGPKDIIEGHNNGILIEEGDASGLAQGLLQLMDDDSLRKLMGANAKQRSSFYSEDHIMNKWINLFEQVLKKG